MSSSSMKDVARHARVSVGTVSNVLNRPDQVAKATRERVQAVIEETGYVRNESARHLRAGRSRVIGMVVLDAANPFFTDVARGAEAVADEAGSVIMLCNSGENPERENRHLDVLLEQRVQGLLISLVDERHSRVPNLIDHGIPIVVVDRGAGQLGLCSVAVDDTLGGKMAVAHLLEMGHRRIAFVGGPMSRPQVADRVRGAHQAIDEAGRGELVLMETGSLQFADGHGAGDRLAAAPAGQRPTAVFCGNDLAAVGMLQAMTTNGLSVPGDMAIVGYDDVSFATTAAVPLSSVRQPRQQLGRTAATLLLEEISEGARHQHRQVVFLPELVVRRSSEVPRVQAVEGWTIQRDVS
jgi:LacI family transcriptional regulator